MLLRGVAVDWTSNIAARGQLPAKQEAAMRLLFTDSLICQCSTVLGMAWLMRLGRGLI